MTAKNTGRNLFAVRIAVAHGRFERVDGWYTDQMK